ncbi:MAG: SDR family oxidoreductase [Sphingobium sp.]
MKIVITGGTGALGAAVTAALNRDGNRLVALVRSPQSDTSGNVAQVLVANLAEPEATRTAFNTAQDILDGIDAIVHLAGGFEWLPVADSKLDDWWSLYATNVATTVNIIQAGLTKMTDGGAILCVGAASAQSAKAGMAPYAAAKSGVARIVEALSEELRPRRIRVNGVAPAIIDTPRNRADMPDADPAAWTSPEAIADVIRFLISSEARAINGAMIPVTNNA